VQGLIPVVIQLWEILHLLHKDAKGRTHACEETEHEFHCYDPVVLYVSNAHFLGTFLNLRILVLVVLKLLCPQEEAVALEIVILIFRCLLLLEHTRIINISMCHGFSMFRTRSLHFICMLFRAARLGNGLLFVLLAIFNDL
jgi:hypothetical protein